MMLIRCLILIFVVVVGIVGILICAENDPATTQKSATGIEILTTVPELLQKELQGHEAFAWYLYHTGYAVKTNSKLLVFDYTRGLWDGQVEPPVRSLDNGWIDPDEIKDLDVYIFVSHSHTDHYDPVIFGWQDTISSINYFFGWEAATGPNYHNMVGPRAIFIDDDIEIYTINSHHSGVPEVAYLIKTDSLAIYHGGDYNSDYEADIAYLGTFVDSLDIAMLNDWCGGPIMEVIEELYPNLVLPGHFGGEEDQPRRLPPCCEEFNLPCVVGCPDRRGEMFHYPGRGMNGKIAFYSNRSGRDDIYLMNVVGSDVQLLTTGEHGGKCPDLSPDGNSVVFVSTRDGNSEIYMLDIVSGIEHRLTDLTSVERQPKWSPNGKKIALQSNRDGNYEIYFMNADGSSWQRLTYTDEEEIWPNWSPGGTQLVFGSFRDGNWEIYTINSDGTGSTRLTESSDLWESGASWSPDGTRIAFRSGPPQQFQGDIYIFDADGTNKNQLTYFDGVEENPEWSPDGKRIAFQTMKDGNFEIYVIDTNGTNIQNLTNYSAHDYWPSWVGPYTQLDIDCGDTNSDGSINIGDAVFLINLIFHNGPMPDPEQVGDVNCDSGINVGDAVYMINYIFQQDAPEPCADC